MIITVRRFITLVDVLYEESSLLVVLAEAPPTGLFEITAQEREDSSHDEVFAFERTISRLLEMQSEIYLTGVLIKQ